MAGVAEHSRYRQDAIGRLRRTASFVEATTFGTDLEAERAIQEVRLVYTTVKGRAPDGRHYDAADPDLVTWVHVTETASFLAAAQRYGAHAFDHRGRDRYYAETAQVATRLGAQWVPRSEAEVDAYLRRMRPHLYAGTQALDARILTMAPGATGTAVVFIFIAGDRIVAVGTREALCVGPLKLFADHLGAQVHGVTFATRAAHPALGAVIDAIPRPQSRSARTARAPRSRTMSRPAPGPRGPFPIERRRADRTSAPRRSICADGPAPKCHR